MIVSNPWNWINLPESDKYILTNKMHHGIEFAYISYNPYESSVFATD